MLFWSIYEFYNQIYWIEADVRVRAMEEALQMIPSAPSSMKPTLESMSPELYMLILNPLSLMKSRMEVTGNSSILNNSFLERKIQLITLTWEIISWEKNLLTCALIE